MTRGPGAAGDGGIMSQTEHAAARTGIVAIVGGALLALASFLPWAEVSGEGASVTAKGIDGSDGYLTLGAGVVAVLIGVVLVMRGSRRILAIITILVGIVGGGLALYDALTAKDSVLDAAAEELAPSFGVSTDQVRAALDQAVDTGQIGVSVSYGLYLAVAGGVIVIVGGILGLRGAEVSEPAASAPDPSDETPPWVPSPSEPSETAVAPPPPPPGPDGD
jgi:hypothetical protein